MILHNHEVLVAARNNFSMWKADSNI